VTLVKSEVNVSAAAQKGKPVLQVTVDTEIMSFLVLS
jgi:hypothetical protein